VSLIGAADSLLVCILLDKMSPETRRSLVRQHGSTDFNLKKLRKAIKNEIEILDDAVIEPFNKRQQHVGSSSQQGRDKVSIQPKSSSSGSSQPLKRFCKLCDGEHSANSCSKFSKSAEREVQARKRKLCFNCLSDKHKTDECQSPYRCKVCKQNHHTALHTEQSGYVARPTVKFEKVESKSSRSRTQGTLPKLQFPFRTKHLHSKSKKLLSSLLSHS